MGSLPLSIVIAEGVSEMDLGQMVDRISATDGAAPFLAELHKSF